MSRPALAWCVTVLALAMSVSCSSPANEPEGLSGESATASGPAGSPSPGAPSAGMTDPAEPSARPGTTGPEPSPTFTQPFLPPGEERVVDLPAELAIDPPDEATDDERAVLAAAGRFMASWDAILFGAGDEQSGIFRTAADPQLGRLLNYLVESISKQRVIVGRPTEIDLRGVTVRDDTAEVDICTIMRDWVQYTGGTPEPQPEVERLVLTMTVRDGYWVASDTEQADPEPCE